MTQTYFFHDYETFGKDPRVDRPAQFAGIRTDTDFRPVAEPVVFYCRPPRDYLPDPIACLITGISPRIAESLGVVEAEFARLIHQEFIQPDTCALGYNTIRFDDEFTRNLFWRNLIDPYEREWRNGNSRWDLIDLSRLVYALRPEGIEWPRTDDGRPSFRLEKLSAANGLYHEHAHDARSDVEATIALARLIRDRQPRLFEYILTHRDKHSARDLLALGRWTPLIHVSEKYSAERGCLAVIVALAEHPTQSQCILAYDLSHSPEELVGMEPDEIRRRIFTSQVALGPGTTRLPIKGIHLNRAPVLAPLNALRSQDAERLAIDLAACLRHLETMRTSPELEVRLRAAFHPGEYADTDPELALYCGFVGDVDRRALRHLQSLSPEQLAQASPHFKDSRLPDILFRYRARNWPETLNPAEVTRWEMLRHDRLHHGVCEARTLDEYRDCLQNIRSDGLDDPDRNDLLASLDQYADDLQADLADPGVANL